MIHEEVKHYRLHVSGRVQGVGFRYSAHHQASLLGIRGYVKNQYDGSVLLEIEGSEESTRRMIQWCKQGPSMSRVDDVEIASGPLLGYTGFSIR